MDPFREEKTPAHDVMQLYLKEHLDEIVVAYLNRYYPESMVIHSGNLSSVSSVASEVSVQKEFKKHIVLDAEINVKLVHSGITYWSNHTEKMNDIDILSNACYDHKEARLRLDLSKYQGKWSKVVTKMQQSESRERRISQEAYSAAKWGSKDYQYLTDLHYAHHRRAEKISQAIPYVKNKLSWPSICADQSYIQTHNLYLNDIIVELKPKIFSFGDVLRQIHEYADIVRPDSKPLLLTPDNRFDKYFESEGVAVIHPDKDALIRLAEALDIPIKEYDFSSAPKSKSPTDQEKKVESQGRLEFE